MIRLWLGLSMGRIGRPQDRVLSLSALEQEELERISRSRSAPHGVVRRAQIILGSASGESNLSIARRLGVSNPTVRHWRKRWFDQGLVGLYGEAKPGRPRTHDEERIAELLRTVLESRPADGTHWTVRSAAKTTGLSKSTVARTGIVNLLSEARNDAEMARPGYAAIWTPALSFHAFSASARSAR